MKWVHVLLWRGTFHYGGVLFIMVGYSLLWWGLMVGCYGGVLWWGTLYYGGVPLIRVGWESGRGGAFYYCGALFIVVGYFFVMVGSFSLGWLKWAWLKWAWLL